MCARGGSEREDIDIEEDYTTSCSEDEGASSKVATNRIEQTGSVSDGDSDALHASRASEQSETNVVQVFALRLFGASNRASHTAMHEQREGGRASTINYSMSEGEGHDDNASGNMDAMGVSQHQHNSGIE